MRDRVRITQRGWAEIAQVFAEYGATAQPVICDGACRPGTAEHHRHLTDYGHLELRRILPILGRDLGL
jgi:hypothetical protein